MAPARVLLLGGSSYVAQFVVERCLKQQHGGNAHAYVVACTLRSSVSLLPPCFTPAPSREDNAEQQVQVYWDVDLMTMTGVRECIRDFRPNVIINCAAVASPALCEKDPEKAQAINEPHALVKFIQRETNWRVRFVHFSTDFVYDGTNPPEQGYKETDAKTSLDSRLTAYGAMKLRFDEFLLSQESLDGFILRIANVLGPSSPYFPNQAPKFMQWLHQQLFLEKKAQDPLTLWSDEIRSYIYVRDLVEILFALLHCDGSLNESRTMTLVNVGGLDALSRVELAQQYCAAWERHSTATTKDAAHGVTAREIAPTRRATVSLGHNPPLNARLNTAVLRALLPSFSWTSTDTFLDEICHELTTKLK